MAGYNYTYQAPDPDDIFGSLGQFNSPAVMGTTMANPGAVAAANTPVPDAWTGGGIDLRTPTVSGSGFPIPGSGTGGGKNSGFNFGFNPGSIDMVTSVLGTLGGLWQAWEQNKIAKETLNLQKQSANVNFANQIKAYNRVLEDVSYNRQHSGGWSPEQTAAYESEHQLKHRPIG
jgi:hypothetical protein